MYGDAGALSGTVERQIAGTDGHADETDLLVQHAVARADITLALSLALVCCSQAACDRGRGAEDVGGVQRTEPFHHHCGGV